MFDAVAAEGRWIGREAPLDRGERLAQFFATLDTRDAATFVVDGADGTLAGVVGVQLSHGAASFGMFVAAAERAHGIGRALVEAAVHWARRQGAHKVSLQVWPHNAAALALYERAGFVVEGRLAREYRRANGELWDAVVMALVLDTESPGSPYPDA